MRRRFRRNKRRTARIAFARQVAMFICRHVTACSYLTIAEAFERDHSTCIQGSDLIRCRIARVRALLEDAINCLQQRCSGTRERK
jgi:chromosomal replication initiation ATPase DnaA